MIDRERAVQRRLRVHAHAEPMRFFRLLSHMRANRRSLRAELGEAYPDIALIWSLSGLCGLLIAELQRAGIPTTFAVLDSWPRRHEHEDPWYHWWTAPLPIQSRILRRSFHSLGLTRLLQSRFPLFRTGDLGFRRAFFSSRALRDSTRNAGFHVEGSEIIPYCIGRGDFPPAALRRPELRRILWIGKIDADDDPMTAVQTIQELRHNGAMRFNLDVFGRGDAMAESRLHNHLRTSQLGGAVTIRHVAGEELTALFSSYDLFLHTARYPGPFPQILLRAMAAQLPVVSTVEGSCGDVIRDGENAIAIRAGHPVDSANKILKLAQDASLVERIARQGYEDVLNIYSSAIVAGRIDKLLTSLLQRRSEV